VALHRQGKPQDAAASFRTFLKLAPQDPAAPPARGYIARQVMRRKPLVTRSAATEQPPARARPGLLGAP
jgi:hypothetical protein